jgi:2-dehydro-3-deoxyphosphogalactonate aldolase
MTAHADFTKAFADCPLIAILRGVLPEEVEEIGEAALSAGIKIIEVPLNSPNAYESIRRLAVRFGSQFIVGAGTVTAVAQVMRVRDAGGRLIVCPNTDKDVISAAVRSGLVCVPGYLTPSEAFAALAAGAHALKLFPAEAASPTFVKALRAVLPKSVPIIAVGGITSDAMAGWVSNGTNGFGLGSSLYKPGDSSREVAVAARAFAKALDIMPRNNQHT